MSFRRLQSGARLNVNVNHVIFQQNKVRYFTKFLLIISREKYFDYSLRFSILLIIILKSKTDNYTITFFALIAFL